MGAAGGDPASRLGWRPVVYGLVMLNALALAALTVGAALSLVAAGGAFFEGTFFRGQRWMEGEMGPHLAMLRAFAGSAALWLLGAVMAVVDVVKHRGRGRGWAMAAVLASLGPLALVLVAGLLFAVLLDGLGAR